MITILDKSLVVLPSGNSHYNNRYTNKDSLCDAMKKFIQSSMLGKMPKNGNGSNATIGQVSIKIGLNHITFNVSKVGSTRHWDDTTIVISIYCFKTLKIDDIAGLLVINDKVAISYI